MTDTVVLTGMQQLLHFGLLLSSRTRMPFRGLPDSRKCPKPCWQITEELLAQEIHQEQCPREWRHCPLRKRLGQTGRRWFRNLDIESCGFSQCSIFPSMWMLISSIKAGNLRSVALIHTVALYLEILALDDQVATQENSPMSQYAGCQDLTVCFSKERKCCVLLASSFSLRERPLRRKL